MKPVRNDKGKSAQPRVYKCYAVFASKLEILSYFSVFILLIPGKCCKEGFFCCLKGLGV